MLAVLKIFFSLVSKVPIEVLMRSLIFEAEQKKNSDEVH